jgi:hypothetical protein
MLLEANRAEIRVPSPSGTEDLWDSAMAWVEPKYTKRKVNWAGDMLAQQDSLPPHDLNQMTVIINNWRSAHNFPLNTFHIGLKKRATSIDSTAITAQRIKRLASIELKLARFSTMTLAQMQDIGGCRAIVENIDQVDKLVELYRRGDLKHELYDVDDYILKPQESGYRGIHLKWKYYSDKNKKYDKLRIEMQLRSRLQHVWATAVETAGTILSMSLKSNLGSNDWRRFFALMSCAFALREGTGPVPDCPDSWPKLRKEIKDLAKKLDVIGKLKMYAGTLNVISGHTRPKDYYYLLVLDAQGFKVDLLAFQVNQSKEANAAYIRQEAAHRNKPGFDVVLVSVDSVKSLHSAYPNYFLDTKIFMELVMETIRSNTPIVGGKRTMAQQLQLL